jgi:cellulose synthase/poly-beta-1,6-N-acetylglucosamine synthase-like glycosyltransferase
VLLPPGGATDVAAVLAEARSGPGRTGDPRPGSGSASIEPISVVVATRGRSRALARCLESIVATNHPGSELVVVDNAPTDDRARRVVRRVAAHAVRWDVRYEVEPRIGASRARNRGWRSARHRVVAFCDDDCVVDRHWLVGVADAFSEPGVDAMTGQVLPAELDTAAQVHFEEYGGFGRGPVRRRFDLGEDRPSSRFFPYNAGRFGSGNNAAFTVEALERVGGFCELLGPGTPTRAGEDLDLFVSVVMSGGRLAYEPSALVWHHHRRTDAELRHQIRSYGTGLAAMVVHQALRSPSSARRIVRLAAPGVRLVLSPTSEKNAGRSGTYPRALVRAELVGLVHGPIAYLRAAVDVRGRHR